MGKLALVDLAVKYNFFKKEFYFLIFLFRAASGQRTAKAIIDKGGWRGLK